MDYIEAHRYRINFVRYGRRRTPILNKILNDTYEPNSHSFALLLKLNSTNKNAPFILPYLNVVCNTISNVFKVNVSILRRRLKFKTHIGILNY